MLLTFAFCRGEMPQLPFLELTATIGKPVAKYALDLAVLDAHGEEIYGLAAEWEWSPKRGVTSLSVSGAKYQGFTRKIIMSFVSGVSLLEAQETGDQVTRFYLKVRKASPLVEGNFSCSASIATMAPVLWPNVSRSRFAAEAVFDVSLSSNGNVLAFALIHTSASAYAKNVAGALSLAQFQNTSDMPGKIRVKVETHFDDNDDEQSNIHIVREFDPAR